MIAGFKDKLHVEGIIGDGCGGGRIFYIDSDELFAYDPITKDSIKLLGGIKDPKAIFKNACVITIECKYDSIEFDLSLLKQ